MGIFFNPNHKNFRESVERKIYVDKSLLIQKVWNHAKDQNKYICISRPRRFGKSTDADMLAAFFSKGCDSHHLFDSLKIAGWEHYEQHMNQYNVIHLNMQMFLSSTHTVDEMIEYIFEDVSEEIEMFYGITVKRRDFPSLLNYIYTKTGESFIFVIDEWDCIFREFNVDKEAQKVYLDYLRLLLKDRSYVEMAYMTGILPIKKYGSHSALNMFDEISMLDAKNYSEFMGFTEQEVRELCDRYHTDYSEMSAWYDGYRMRDGISTYSPRSVTASIYNRDFSNYWSQTETYEALKHYIDLNYDGLKDTIIDLLAGKKVRINTLDFQNDMTTFSSGDDVLTLLIHLGYLGYLQDLREVYIPNREVRDVFISSIRNADWSYVTEVFKNANDLLDATWNGREEQVAFYIERSHYETSILQYNDENALAYTVSLAYITAREYYQLKREFATGKGFADLVFIPHSWVDRPAMIIELKWAESAETGIEQIKNKKYYLGLTDYLDNLLLVGISYDRKTKKHQCKIEQYRPE